MEDKKVMKNMEYWKKKNNIPGIEALDMAGLTDGRAKSSAFQMAAPVAPNVFGEDENTEVGKELLKEEAKKAIQTAAKQAGGMGGMATGITMKKSPFQQEEEEKRIYVGGTYEVGDLVSEDDLEEAFKREGNDPKDYPQLSVQDYSEIKEDENGMYVILQEGGPVDPDAPGTPGTPGFEPPVQPGGPQMHSPNKIYGVGGERRKNYTYQI